MTATQPSLQPEPVVCLCGCHHGCGMHIVPCCQGRCSVCGKWFKSGLRLHTETCGGTPEWSSADTHNRG